MKALAWPLLAALATQTGQAQYRGSSFSEVWRVVRDVGFAPTSPEEAREFSIYRTGLPSYPVSADSLFSHGSKQLERDARRTVSEREDYYGRLPKLLHPNGVCVAGTWNITEMSKYTGLFQQGSKALFIGRVSVTLGSTQFEQKRGFGFSGKVFPTMDAGKVIPTANFFTADVLLGRTRQRFLDAALTNEPDSGFDISLVGLGLKLAAALATADDSPTFRPLYPLARVGTPTAESVSPHWMRLRAKRTSGSSGESDFRNEVLGATAQGQLLTFEIDVSDTTSNPGSKAGWRRVGEIRVAQAVASYGCDRRLHFAHPPLKPPADGRQMDSP